MEAEAGAASAPGAAAIIDADAATGAAIIAAPATGAP